MASARSRSHPDMIGDRRVLPLGGCLKEYLSNSGVSFLVAHPDLHFAFPVAVNERVKKHPISSKFYEDWRIFFGTNPYGSLFNWYQDLGIENKQGQIGVDEAEVKISASFVDDLNADSLDLVELVMSLEEEFSTESKRLEIPDEDAEKIKTVQDAVDYIKEQGVEDE